MSTPAVRPSRLPSDNGAEQECIELSSLTISQDNGGRASGILGHSRSSLSQCLSAWRTGMLLNICGAIIVLIINISFPAWAAGKYTQEADRGYLYRGSCEETNKLATLGHAVINILGTLLLSGSNYAMQVLAAPTRAEVDIAHRRKVCLCIGVQSFRNFMSFSYSRGTIWMLLAISSIPLHLLYNSVIFSVSGVNAYMIAVVSSDFQNGAPFNLSQVNDIETPSSDSLISTDSWSSVRDPKNFVGFMVPAINSTDHVVISELQAKAQKNELITITKEECIKTYSDTPQTKYRNVLAVSDNVRSNSSVVWVDHSFPTASDPRNWICAYEPLNLAQEFKAPDQSCITKYLASDWSVGFYFVFSESDQKWRWGSHPVSRCLVEPIGACGIKYDMRILVTVIIANLVKVLAMTATLLQYKRPALVTIGDALASFLEIPDETTHGMCLSEQKDFSCSSWAPTPKMYAKSGHALLRSSGASQLQWGITSALFAFSGLTAAISFAIIYDDSDVRRWSYGDSIDSDSIRVGKSLNDASLIVIANLPQLILSIDYISLNRLVTCMAGSREWSLFAHQKKGLRTSQRKGAQRSTYWLQLPLKISIPLMAVSAGLHYIASQCLYFRSFQSYAYYGRGITLESRTGLGYSQTAIYVLMVALILPMAAVKVWGREYNKLGIPPAGFCSAAISAACHPLPEEENLHLKPIQWGEVTQCGDPTEVGHCSFSSKDVTMPVEGREYM